MIIGKANRVSPRHASIEAVCGRVINLTDTRSVFRLDEWVRKINIPA